MPSPLKNRLEANKLVFPENRTTGHRRKVHARRIIYACIPNRIYTRRNRHPLTSFLERPKCYVSVHRRDTLARSSADRFDTKKPDIRREHRPLESHSEIIFATLHLHNTCRLSANRVLNTGSLGDPSKHAKEDPFQIATPKRRDTVCYIIFSTGTFLSTALPVYKGP